MSMLARFERNPFFLYPFFEVIAAKMWKAKGFVQSEGALDEKLGAKMPKAPKKGPKKSSDNDHARLR